MVNLKINTYYKTKQGDTILIFEKEEDFYLGFWHEQMLDEPSHCHILFNKQGQCLNCDGIPYDIEDNNVIREVTEIEKANIKKEAKDAQGW